SSSVTVSKGATLIQPSTTHFLVTDAPGSSTPGTAFNITVTAADVSNSTQTGYAGKVHFTSTDSAAVLPADSTLTGGSQIFSITLNTAGAQLVTVSDIVSPGITGGTGVIQNGSVTTPSGVSYFKVNAPTTAQTTGSQFAVTVTAVDSSGNTFTGYSGKVHFT